MPLIPDALREDVGEVPGREQDGNDRVDTLWPDLDQAKRRCHSVLRADSVAPLTNRVFLQALNQRECAAGEAMFLS
jgi:hypothetical protein